MQLYNSTPERKPAQTPIVVMCDGVRCQVEAGGSVILLPGESITLTPFLWHTFHAVEDDALIGEVSSLNDDVNDNFFLDPLPRYPEIVEDEPPLRLLCHEYPRS